MDGLRDEDAQVLDQMLRSLAHRGPDDQHMRGDTLTLLGARRLSIIDLERGRQPLTDETDTVIASQNGEIYNYVELRGDLEARGHRFRTHGDTETIVHLYQEHGIDFPRHLRGMFAIALWDSTRRRLVLARDRVGKKPLYWRLADGRLTYGSELKSIIAAPTVSRVVDQEALGLYLQYDYVPAPRTILHGISKLPPASVLVWDGGEPTISQYWAPEYEPKTRRSFEEDLAEGQDLMREAVRIRLRSDVPVGVFLSGGIDSGLVTAMMAEASTGPVRTFSIGFDDQAFDELPYARQVAERLGTMHDEEVVRIDALGLLPELADHYDEPFADPSAVPTFRVAQMAGKHLKVVLTGDGGDEAFGGYTRYLAHLGIGRSPIIAAARRSLDLLPPTVIRGAARSGRALLAPLGPDSRLLTRLELAEAIATRPADERYMEAMTTIGALARSQLLRDNDLARGSEGYLLDALRGGPTGRLDRILHADLRTYLSEDLLVKMDRATMACSLEARSPLLDQRVIEFAARLPIERKIQGSTTKVLLRAIARRYLPAELIDRPKHGFGAPIADWFRGELGTVFQDTVLAADARSRDFMDVEVAGRLFAQHRSRRTSTATDLWALLMFELWARRWLTPSGSDAPSPGAIEPARATAPTPVLSGERA